MRRLLTWAVMATVVLGLAGDLSAQTAVEDPFGPKEESIAELIDKVRSAWSISRPKALERLDYAIAQRTDSRDGPVRAFYGSNDDQRAILETGIPTVAGFLRDKNAKVRAEALSCLATMQTPFPHEAKNIVPKLTVALNDQDAEVRRRAAWELGMVADNVDCWLKPSRDVGNEREFPPGEAPASAASVDGSAAKEFDLNQERKAILAAYADASTALVNVLDDPDADVRQQAVSALGDICRLAQGDPSICREIARTIPSLIAGLRDEDPHHRAACLSALSTLALDREGASFYARAMSQAVAPVVGLVDDPDHAVRVSAIATLGDMAFMADNEALVSGVLDAVPLLLDRLNDESFGIRVTASRTLGCYNQLYPLSETRHRLSEVPQALAQVAASDNDESVRREASFALNAWKWDSRTAHLVDDSSHGQKTRETPGRASFAKGDRIDDKPAHPDADFPAMAPIGSSVGDDNYTPAPKVEPSADHRNGPNERPPVSTVAADRSSSDDIGTQAIPVLIKALGSSHPNIRRQAAEQLGRMGKSAAPAAEPLLRMIGDEREDEQVRLAALKAFEAIHQD